MIMIHATSQTLVLVKAFVDHPRFLIGSSDCLRLIYSRDPRMGKKSRLVQKSLNPFRRKFKVLILLADSYQFLFMSVLRIWWYIKT